MDNIIEEIKERVRIEDLIEESGIPLERRHGRYLRSSAGRGQGLHGLVIDTYNNTYHFNGQDEHGDVFNWVMNRMYKGWDFKAALEFLAKRIGLALPDYGEKNMQARLAVRAQEDAFQVAARVFHKWLLNNEAALTYVRGRGFSDETIVRAKMGFSGSGSATDFKEMAAEFALYGVDPTSAAAVAITGLHPANKAEGVSAWCQAHGIEPDGEWLDWGMIPGMMSKRTPRLVYASQLAGRVIYLFGRNLKIQAGGEVVGSDDPKSYNLNSRLIGSRKLYFNPLYGRRVEDVVLVEGPADAETLGQWGIAAIANGGTAWKDHEDFLKELPKHRDEHGHDHGHDAIYLGADADDAGQKVILGRDGEFPLADVLGPMVRVLRWKAKDANDWLKEMVKEGVTAEEQAERVREQLDRANPIVVEMAKHAGLLPAKSQKAMKAAKRAAQVIARLDKRELSILRKDMATAMFPGASDALRQFNNLIGEERKEAKEEDKPDVIVEMLGGWMAQKDGKGWLIEYTYEPVEKKAMFAFRDPDGRIGTANFLDIDGTRYYPKTPNALVIDEGILFPAALGKEKSTRELVAIVELFIARYFLLDNKFDYRLAAYYVLLTWLYDAFGALPYLRAQGDYGSGKSELMLRIGHVCYRMMKTSGAGSSSSLFRALHEYRGTAFMDEMDLSRGGDMTDDIVKILNMGAMKSQANIWRTSEVMTAKGTRDFETISYSVYGPKLITMRGKFHDQATESRCLTFRLMAKEAIELKRKGIPLLLNRSFYDEAREIRNLLLHWRLKRWQPEIPATEDLMDLSVPARLNQVTMPLKAIAQDDPELMNDIVKFVRALNNELILDRSMKLDARVMDAVVAILEDKRYAHLLFEGEVNGYGVVKYSYTRHIADVTNALIDEMNMSDERDDKDDDKRHKKKKEITTQTVSGICRETLQFHSHRLGKGYVIIFDTDRLDTLKLRYGLNKAGATPAMAGNPAQAVYQPAFGEAESDVDEPMNPDEPDSEGV
jgi:DNA primase